MPSFIVTVPVILVIVAFLEFLASNDKLMLKFSATSAILSLVMVILICAVLVPAAIVTLLEADVKSNIFAPLPEAVAVPPCVTYLMLIAEALTLSELMVNTATPSDS